MCDHVLLARQVMSLGPSSLYPWGQAKDTVPPAAKLCISCTGETPFLALGMLGAGQRT